ncbi:hypothetical protein [Streptomyces lydicus]|uniref:hypothetical protein n=1 Tax=Streptomyces lydicus TaxID=47763 RepID=UPI00367AE823
MQNDAAVAAPAAAAAAGAERGEVVGAGTVTSVEGVERAAAAGARFTVAPGFCPEVAEASLAAGLPHLPGARFVATGGMNLANTPEFPAAGAAAVSLGSALSDAGQFARLPELIADLKPTALQGKQADR